MSDVQCQRQDLNNSDDDSSIVNQDDNFFNQSNLHVEVNVVIPADVSVPTHNSNSYSKGPFEHFFEDQNNVSPKNNMKYILLVVDGIIEDCNDPSTTFPFSQFFGKKGYIQSLKITRDVVMKEIVCRNPDARVNYHNKTILEMKDILKNVDPSPMKMIYHL